MELWIRSQDKDILMKVDNLLVDDEKNHIYTQNYINNMQMTYTLGRYKTRERALEVLDEIQNALLNKWADNVKYEEHYDDENPRTMVYIMPKE